MPFKSEAQRRLFHVMEDRGEMPHKTVEEWEHSTKNKKSLPYHKSKKASVPLMLLPGGVASHTAQAHSQRAMMHATKKLQKANSREKRAMNETIERAFLDELQSIGVEKLAEETEKERAHKWGKRGTMLSLAPQAASGVMLAGLAANKHTRGDTLHAMRSAGGGSLKGFAGKAALSAGINAAGGYGMGRLAHRAIHGKATDKKVKEAAFKLPVPVLRGMVKGKQLAGQAANVIKDHPLKSVAGAAAVGRYVMPKQKEAAAMGRAAQKLKKLSMGAACY